MSFQFSRGMAVGLALVGGAAAAAGCDAIAGIQSGTLSSGGSGDGGADSTASDGSGGDSSVADTSIGGDSGVPDSTPVGDSGGDGGGDGGDGGGDPVVQISAGGAASCAVTRSGALYCWGGNMSGAVGDGTTTMRPTAVHITKDVAGMTLPPITQVSAGEAHVCARANTGAIYCWGNDSAGQLGDGVNVLTDAAVGSTDKHAPQLVAGVMAPAVACGFLHTCTLQSNGATLCWGSNQLGELGHQPGTMGDVTLQSFFAYYANSSPLPGANVQGSTQLSLGVDFTCANDPGDGWSFCWGNNSEGQLGNLEAGAGSTPVFVPVQVLVDPGGVLTAGKEVAASSAFGHACAVDGQGNLYCWGSSGAGQLATAAAVASGTYSYATMIMASVSHVAVAGWTTCIIDATQHVKCWGGNANGQLGHDPTTDPISSCPDNSGPCNPNPSTILSGTNPFGPASAISVGLEFACVLKTDATVWCWGDNSGGELGNNQQGSNDAGQNYNPVQVVGLP